MFFELFQWFAIFVAQNGCFAINKPTFLHHLPHWGIGKGVAVVGFEGCIWTVKIVTVHLHGAVVVGACVSAVVDVHFRCDALDAQALAHWFHQKSWRCGNNYVIILALVEIPFFDMLLIFVPKLFHVLFLVGDKHQKPTHNGGKLAIVHQVQKVAKRKKGLHYQKQCNVGEADKAVEVESTPTVAL